MPEPTEARFVELERHVRRLRALVLVQLSARDLHRGDARRQTQDAISAELTRRVYSMKTPKKLGGAQPFGLGQSAAKSVERVKRRYETGHW